MSYKYAVSDHVLQLLHIEGQLVRAVLCCAFVCFSFVVCFFFVRLQQEVMFSIMTNRITEENEAYLEGSALRASTLACGCSGDGDCYLCLCD